MALMRSHDVTTELEDELEPGPVAIGPSGIHIRDNAKSIPPPPRLCEAGPCRHYHRFAAQLDAETPIGDDVQQGGKQSGRVTGGGGSQPFHVETHHYCYPTVGIELQLGPTPVLECSLWEPVTTEEVLEAQDRRDAFLKSPRGEAYARELADWHKAREDEARAADLPAISMLYINVKDVDIEFHYEVDGDETLRQCRVQAIGDAYPNGGETGAVDPVDWLFFDSQGNEITNLDATLHTLGIANGEHLTLARASKGA